MKKEFIQTQSTNQHLHPSFCYFLCI